MITADFDNLKIAGISAAVPSKHIDAHEYDSVFGEDTVSKNIELTGIKSTYQLGEKQTPSDLAFVAARRLISETKIDPKKIGILIFASPYFDYILPPTACVLHDRLGLSTDCIAFDINLACSGFVYGITSIFSLLQSSNAQYGLLLTSDIGNALSSPFDRSMLLFGAGGTATLVEKTSEKYVSHFGMKTDGSRFNSIIIPAGAFRHPKANHERIMRADGVAKSDYDTFMDGVDVFSFSMTEVPKLAKEFLDSYKYSVNDFEAFIFHQANLFMLQRIIKKLGIPKDKMPISLDSYGNTSISSIPLTICNAFHSTSGEKQFFIYGFGVGLSWACGTIYVKTDHVYPIEYTDEYFDDESKLYK